MYSDVYDPNAEEVIEDQPVILPDVPKVVQQPIQQYQQVILPDVPQATQQYQPVILPNVPEPKPEPKPEPEPKKKAKLNKKIFFYAMGGIFIALIIALIVIRINLINYFNNLDEIAYNEYKTAMSLIE